MLWFHPLWWTYLLKICMVISAFSLFSWSSQTPKLVFVSYLTYFSWSLRKLQVTHHEYEVETTNGRTITKRRKTKSTVMFDVRKIESLAALLAIVTRFNLSVSRLLARQCTMSLNFILLIMKGSIKEQEEKDTKSEDSQRGYQGMTHSLTCFVFTCLCYQIPIYQCYYPVVMSMLRWLTFIFKESIKAQS